MGLLLALYNSPVEVDSLAAEHTPVEAGNLVEVDSLAVADIPVGKYILVEAGSLAAGDTLEVAFAD